MNGTEDNSAPVSGAGDREYGLAILTGLLSLVMAMALGLIGLVLSIGVAMALSYSIDKGAVVPATVSSIIGGLIGFVVLMVLL